MRFIVDSTRLENGGSVVVMNAVTREVSEAVNTLSPQVDENTVIVIRAELWTKEFLAQTLKTEKEMQDGGGADEMDAGDGKSDSADKRDTSTEGSADDAQDGAAGGSATEPSSGAEEDDGIEPPDLDLGGAGDPFEEVEQEEAEEEILTAPKKSGRKK